MAISNLIEESMEKKKTNRISTLPVSSSPLSWSTPKSKSLQVKFSKPNDGHKTRRHAGCSCRACHTCHRTLPSLLKVQHTGGLKSWVMICYIKLPSTTTLYILEGTAGWTHQVTSEILKVCLISYSNVKNPKHLTVGLSETAEKNFQSPKPRDCNISILI